MQRSFKDHIDLFPTPVELLPIEAWRCLLLIGWRRNENIGGSLPRDLSSRLSPLIVQQAFRKTIILITPWT
jgi:hypothetical protein